MARTREPAMTAKEQAIRHEERLAVDAAAAARRAALALEDVGDETARIRKLQADLGIKRFETVAEAAPLLEIERVLRNNYTRIQDERDLLSIERYLSGGMGAAGIVAPRGEKAKEFAARRDQLKKKLKISTVEPAPRQPDAIPPEVKAGLEVFSAGAPKAPQSHAGRLAELDTMQIVVDEAIRVNRKQIDELRGVVGFEMSTRLQKKHGELSIAVFRAAQQLSEAAEAERSLRSAYTSAGYSSRTDLLPAPGVLGAILMLGSESDYSSQLSSYRRFLQSRNLLP
jgi:hypothetical protein